MTLADRIARMEPDAQRVVLWIVAHVVERLEVGRRRYGDLDLADDPRCFLREAREEWIDGLIYTASDDLLEGDVSRAKGRPDVEITAVGEPMEVSPAAAFGVIVAELGARKEAK